MTLILDAGRNITWMMKLNLCLVSLIQIVEIKYRCWFLNQPMSQNVLWVYYHYLSLIHCEEEGAYSEKNE